MRVKIETVTDIDVDAWMEAYGVERADVRDDVKLHMIESIHQQLHCLGLAVGA